MYLAQWFKNSYCYKISCNKILNSLKWETPQQVILKKNVMMIHKMMVTGKPKQLMKLIRIPRTRIKAKMTTKYTPKNQQYLTNHVLQAIQQYNKLDDEIKELDVKKFKKKLKKIYLKPP